MPRRNSLDGARRSVELSLKQSTKNGSCSVNIPASLGLSRAFALKFNQGGNNSRQEKLAVETKTRLCWYLAFPQKSNTMRFRLPRQISQEIAERRRCGGGGRKHTCMRVGNSQSRPILTTHWFVQHCCICLPDFFSFQ